MSKSSEHLDSQEPEARPRIVVIAHTDLTPELVKEIMRAYERVFQREPREDLRLAVEAHFFLEHLKDGYAELRRGALLAETLHGNARLLGRLRELYPNGADIEDGRGAPVVEIGFGANLDRSLKDESPLIPIADELGSLFTNQVGDLLLEAGVGIVVGENDFLR